MMRIGFVGPVGASIENSFSMNSDELLSETGQNTGNLAFWYGASRMIGAQMKRVRWHDDPQALKDEIDILVIPAANFLMETTNLWELHNLVTKLDKPVVMFGLGAQSENEQVIPKLKDGTLALLKAVSSRTPFIGVRGEFSKLVCESYGVNNVRSLGCPSIFINGNQKLGIGIEKKMLNPVQHFSTASASLKNIGHFRKAESKLFHYAKEFNGKYVIQRPASLLKIIRGEVGNKKDIEYVERFCEFIDPTLDINLIIKFLKTNAVYFASAHSWLEFQKTTTHTVNTRIHGTILPISAGVPSICVTHDTRTRELSKRLCIPHVSDLEFSRFDGGISELFDAVEFSGSDFDENRRILSKDYHELFSLVGLNTSAHFKTFL